MTWATATGLSGACGHAAAPQVVARQRQAEQQQRQGETALCQTLLEQGTGAGQSRDIDPTGQPSNRAASWLVLPSR